MNANKLLTLVWMAGCVLALASAASADPVTAVAPFSLSNATAYLDAGADAHEDHCFACHSTFAYLAARPAIGTMTATHRETWQAMEDFATKLAGEKLSLRDTPQLRVCETVMTAAALAQHDAITEKKLLPLTRKTLDRIWDLHSAPTAVGTGSNWVIRHRKSTTTLAWRRQPSPWALRRTTMPPPCKPATAWRESAATSAAHPAANMHQLGMLMLAAASVDGLLGDKQLKQSVAKLFALKNRDGGWSMASFGDWKRADGGAMDRAASDGYGTGFAVYVLRRGGRIAADDPRLQKGLLWLRTHQQASGSWFTRSPHQTDELSTYAGTAYAILALYACGELPSRAVAHP